MLINQKPTIPGDESEMFLEGTLCINSKQWLMAYTIFNQLTSNAKEKSGSLLYNMALCNFHASEYQKTVNNLNEALTKLAGPSVFGSPIPNLPITLLTDEYEDNSHHFGLTETCIKLNISIVKLRIRRLLVDAHVNLENWDEVRRLSALPEMEKCKNVKEAIALAKTKSNT